MGRTIDHEILDNLRQRQTIANRADCSSVIAVPSANTKVLTGTIMHSLFDAGKLRLDSSVPRDIIKLIEQAKTIEPLLG